MAHSVEFLLDQAADQRIRFEWQALLDAGLPSQITVASSTNRPHITVVAAPLVDPSIDTALVPVGMRLPTPATIGAPIVFGSGPRRSLARLVVPSAELLSLHAQVIRLGADHLSSADGHLSVFPHCRPGRWTPHVTLARRIPVDRIGDALAILGEISDDDADSATVSLTALRRWDGDARAEHVLAGRAC